MNKFIYISLANFSSKIYRDWFIEDLINLNFSIEYWDISNIFYENIIDLKTDKNVLIKEINSFKALENSLKDYNNGGIINIVLIVSLNLQTLKVYKILNKFNVKLIFIEQGALPIYKQNKLLKIKQIIYNPFKYLKIIFSNQLIELYKKNKFIKEIDLLFTVGGYYQNEYLNSKILSYNLNLCDFDQLKLIQNEKSLFNFKFAVFLDINAIDNPDYLMLNMKILDSELYYNTLNIFFNKLEKKFNLKIIIAAHPTTNIEKCNYNDRIILKYNTGVLVKFSEFVITHHSTSISYAILSNKPILSIYTNQMEAIYKNSIMRNILALSQFLKIESYKIDDIDFNKIKLDLNPDLYTKYKYNFLTTPSSEYMISKNIFTEAIIKNILF